MVLFAICLVFLLGFWKKRKETVGPNFSNLCKKVKSSDWRLVKSPRFEFQLNTLTKIIKNDKLRAIETRFPMFFKKRRRNKNSASHCIPNSNFLETLTKGPFRKGQHVLSTKLCQMVFEATSNQTNYLCLLGIRSRSQSLHPKLPAGRNKAFILRRPYQVKICKNGGE